MTSLRREHAESLLDPGAPLRKRALAMSVLVHLVAAVTFDGEGALPPPRRTATVWMEIAPAKTKPEPPAPPSPAPKARTEPEQSVAPRPRKIAARPEAPPQPAEAPPEAPPSPDVADAPLDLRSVMLGGHGAGFSVAGVFSGTGSKGTGRAAPRNSVPPPEAPPPAPRAGALVPARLLAARPVPPALEDKLRHNYPEDARRRGLGGRATVRARIDPDGVARAVAALSETLAGFGEACRRTVTGSRWSPPKDHSGRAVATEVRYTCNFIVQ
ncbi:MAG TPA: TonB family protein [Polyangiaceae bacterium]|nr:TonB family protein [Polyangiaceae bacterium]